MKKNSYILETSVFILLFLSISSILLGQEKGLSPMDELKESWFLKSLSDTGTLVLESEEYEVHGPAPIYDDEGKVHVYFSRWPKKTSWLTHSEIAHAVADKPEGPYKVLGTILKGRGGDYWDANSIHNPTVYRVGSKYVLLYMGSNISKKETWREKGQEANCQRVGMAIADSPNGPWKRFDEPVIDVSSNSEDWDEYCICNPGFVQHPNGEFWLYYRVWDRNHDGRRKTGVAFADKLEGPYKKYEDNPVIDKWEGLNGQTEDPHFFYYDNKFHCIIRDMGNYSWSTSLYLSSDDGLNWSRPQLAKYGSNHYFEGIPQGLRYERDQVLMKDKVPEYLFSATQIPGGRRVGIVKLNIKK